MKFLEKYYTMDKTEFFIMTTLQENNRNDLLDETIIKYRNGEIAETKIVSNINAFQYITSLMIQFGIVEKADNFIKLTSDFKTAMGELL